MFDIAPSELALVAVVALVVIGPKDLPRVMRVVGQWTGKARAMASHFRAGIDEMVREAELAEMEKKWREENERIMREHPPGPMPPEEAEPVMTPLPHHPAEMPVADGSHHPAEPHADPEAPELPLGAPKAPPAP